LKGKKKHLNWMQFMFKVILIQFCSAFEGGGGRERGCLLVKLTNSKFINLISYKKLFKNSHLFHPIPWKKISWKTRKKTKWSLVLRNTLKIDYHGEKKRNKMVNKVGIPRGNMPSKQCLCICRRTIIPPFQYDRSTFPVRSFLFSRRNISQVHLVPFKYTYVRI